MKSFTKKNQLLCIGALALVIAFSSCSKNIEEVDLGPEPISGADADSINGIIANLSYDADRLLNVQSNTGDSPQGDEYTGEYDLTKGVVFECKTQDMNIRSNFEDVVMFDPGLAVIYPGALIIGNREMLSGAPQPLQVDKAPSNLRVNLPGIGEGGNITVTNPTYQNTQAEIDKTLEFWNAEIAPQGYAIDADAYFESTTAYSKEQLSLSLGVGAEWAGGSNFESNFEYTKTTTKRVAAQLYRQVYYEIVAETPESPAAVFGSNATPEQIKGLISDDNPPAYVSSVQYGRIIMIRMETTDTETEVNLEAVLNYATKAKTATGEINASYDKVIKESTFNVVTIGGNAEVATSIITGTDVEGGEGGLNYVITESSLYNRENPGAPIGYTIKYLKDNKIAKMGYNTDYRIETCGYYDYTHKNVGLKKEILVDVRYRFSYKDADSGNTIKYYPSSGYVEVDERNRYFYSTPPDGAYDVKIEFQYWDLGWKNFNGTFNPDYVSSPLCYEATCTKRFAGICTEYSVSSTDCD
ncbi:thiol-activated cytolysin family protein [Croceivirga thetidis]|uniref:Thiol-activated cytolysin n=1 Tax=Croceivirga thetidis TaxID=2721623 RepID=A0ABX1GR42_9FLAO|nr:thiol-activated cytolysin family protein [Croceivirga thetidis]NKI32386.1 hypothetical protein [Croceivirga thetidis]